MRSQWTVALTMIPVLKRVLIATAFLLLALTTVAFQVSTTCNNRYVVINQRASLKTTFSHSFRSSISNQQIYGAHGMVVSGEEEGKVDDANDIITASIKVSGDVGGYYRACVSNEAGKFRRLVGTMSMPDGSSEAEIYVEGKRKMVEGFVRWCKRSKVGLSQKVEVDEVVLGDEPLGLYDDFYCKTKED